MSEVVRDRARWTPWVAAAASVVGLLLLTAEPGVLTGASLLGHGTPDVWGHAWGYAWAADALASGHLPLCQAPVGFPESSCWLLVDSPVALALAPIAWLLGAGVAWNVGVLGRVALGAWTLTWWLERRRVAPWVAVGAGLLWGVSPFVRGAIASGAPEALSVGALPLVAYGISRGMQGSWRALVAASLGSMALVLDGFYGAVPLGIVMAVVAFDRVRDRRALVRWCIPTLAAVLTLAGAWLVLRWTAHPSLITEGFAGGVDNTLHGRWVVSPFRGADLLNLVAPLPLLGEVVSPHLLHRHTAYLGLLLIPAALVGWRRREVRPLLAMAAVAALLALGPRLSVAGVASVPLPGAALTALGMDKLYRLAGLAVMALLAAGAFTWSRLPRAVAGVWMAAVLAEGLLLAPLEARLAAVDDPTGPLERWLSTQEGAVVDLPLNRYTKPSGPWPQRGFMLQAAHGRPVASDLERPAPVLRVHTVGVLDRAVVRTWEREREWGRTRAPWQGPPSSDVSAAPIQLDAGQARADRQLLVDQGFAWVVLDRDGLPPSLGLELSIAIFGWLGQPARCEGNRCAWSLVQ